MLKALLLGGSVLALIAAIQPAEARLHHGGIGTGAAISCPYGTGSGDNGCAYAAANNPNGSFYNPNLINTAQQSGQNSLLPLHSVVANGIVPYNMPGVDYHIGVDTSVTQKDPRTVTLANSQGVCQWATTFLDCSSNGSGVV